VIRAPQGETFSVISVEQGQEAQAEASEPESHEAGAEAPTGAREADATGAGV
jgi:hypothetical protein